MSKKNKNNKKKNIKNNIKKYINKIKKSKTKFTLSEMLSITVIAILIGILIGSSTAYSGDSITVTKIPEDLEEFITTYNNIKENYYDKVKEKDGKLVHHLEIDFIINVDRNKINIKLSDEHSDYKWVTKDSPLLDDFIKSKLSNI